MTQQPELVFVSPRFLFPTDTGGAIRTTEILRGMRGGTFRIKLLSPASGDSQNNYSAQLSEVADEWQCWPAPAKRSTLSPHRIPLLVSSLPVPVASDYSACARAMIALALARRPQVVVFDFLHSAVLAPNPIAVPSVLFTHNVEAEIFERNLHFARNVWSRLVWRNQLKKMRRFEGESLRRFDCVIAVSARDAQQFDGRYGQMDVEVIPTGVNVEYFRHALPLPNGGVVFTGSMDWLANIDAISWFHYEIWPLIASHRFDATMTVVGRNPPQQLVNLRSTGWSFTGRVDDVRPHVRGAAAFVIPMRIGGGTRIKAYEAMAMGIPVVSTSVGVEGLDVQPGEHFLLADSAADFAAAVLRLMQQPDLGRRLSEQARQHVQKSCSNRTVARKFEAICERAIVVSRNMSADSVAARQLPRPGR